ncbi:MAG: hypothetical protein M3R38_07155 [Actinomycetota bacterium]|nr:hypothetical protein [Actinomycetota bacterium]
MGSTPGPWHLAGERGEWVNDEHNMNICRVNPTVSVAPNGIARGDGPRSHESNARLIAASPKLLEALRLALAAYEGRLSPSVAEHAVREAIGEVEE